MIALWIGAQLQDLPGRAVRKGLHLKENAPTCQMHGSALNFVCCLQSAGMPHNLHCIFTSLEGICPLTYEALSSMRPCAVFRLHSAVEMGRYTVTCCLLDACHASLLLNLSRRSNRSDQLQHWQMLGVDGAPQSIQRHSPSQ